MLFQDTESIRGVIFDNDGTLVDTYDLILSSSRHATREVLGIDIPEEKLMAKVGQPLATQVKDFTDDVALQQRWLEVYREHNHAHHDDAIKVYPGIPELLAQLKERGIAMGVVTSKKSPLARRGLELFGLLDYMSFVIGPDECPEHKPSPEPVTMAACILDLFPRQCVYVGDSPFDMQAANGAGCISAAALWGMFPKSVLEAQSPDVMLESPLELLDFLDRR